MSWSDAITILVVLIALMLACGLLFRVFGRRFCRPDTWKGGLPSRRGFGCCCGRPGDRDDWRSTTGLTRMSDRPPRGAGD